MEYYFGVQVKLELLYDESKEASNHGATLLSLVVSPNVDRDVYMNEETGPTKAGDEAITVTLVQGLIAAIHEQHDKGRRDSAEHLRYIISELERGFSTVAEVTRYKPGDKR